MPLPESQPNMTIYIYIYIYNISILFLDMLTSIDFFFLRDLSQSVTKRKEKFKSDNVLKNPSSLGA